MCKVSIIIPIYNAEKYLRRALNSIISQTYTHWEAILIDDGSIDSSGKIAHEYANHDSRFIIIHQNNKGVSFARNQGLNAASGDYICFLDADDFYHSQALELCVNLAKKENADLVAFTYNRRYRVSNIIRHLLHLPESCPSSKTIIEPRYLFTQDIFKYATEYSSTSKIPPKWAIRHCQPWRCLYRHECIKNIYFIEGIIYEDFPWWSEVLLRIKRTVILNLPLYYYYPNPRSYLFSSNREYKKQSLKIAIKAAEELYADAHADIRKAWTENFLIPFKQKLKKKS